LPIFVQLQAVTRRKNIPPYHRSAPWTARGWVWKERRLAPLTDFIGIELCSYYRKQQPLSNSKETVTESANSIMIKRWLLHILEHGTVPAVALALAIAPTNSRSWQRHDLTEPTKRGTEILFSAPTTDTMTLAAKDHEPVVASTKARALTAALTVPTIGRTADRRQTN
jgi:hypothetical protein